MKNILVIQGGGRPKGNTAQLIDHFVAGAKEAGHSVEEVSLIKNEVKGCAGMGNRAFKRIRLTIWFRR